MMNSRSCSISDITLSMWTRFSAASSASKDSLPRSGAYYRCSIDGSVTGPKPGRRHAGGRRSIRLLRIAALSLKEHPGSRPGILWSRGLSCAETKLKASQIEYKNIRDRLWRVRAGILTADYHLRKGRTKTARRTLVGAVKQVPTKGRRRGADDTYLDIAIRQAQIGDFQAALATARRISISIERLEAYLLIADKAAISRDAKTAASSKKMYSDAFALAKTLKGNVEQASNVLFANRTRRSTPNTTRTPSSHFGIYGRFS